jgi:membrane dipeptidase
MNRRRALRWLGAPAAALASTAACPSDLWISDTHSHSALRFNDNTCLRCELTQSGVNLLSWALVADGPYIQRMPNGAIQVNFKASPEQFREAFNRMFKGMQRRIQTEKLQLALQPDDVDKALQGQLHIVLSTEGAQYLGGDPLQLDVVYEQGVRQIGLGHFVEGDLLDIRTEAPKLGGLSALGREVIQRCNALGILVDLAHASDQAVAQALEVSQQPMLWSHSAITRQPTDWRSRNNHVMSISLANAKVLARRGGVVGVWPSRFNFDDPRAYVAALGEAVDMVGEDHLAFGTDMQGLAPAVTMMTNYSAMREVVNLMLASNMQESVVRKIAGENYARLLKTVMLARSVS